MGGVHVGVRISWGTAAHAGLVRAANQDAVLAGPFVFAVADGMGGHSYGEVASSTAVGALAVVNARGKPTPSQVCEAVVTANRRVMAAARKRQVPLGGMGTTLAGIAFCEGRADDRVLIFHAGDSRVYRLRRRRLEQLTADHTVANDASMPQPTAGDVLSSHMITRALGVAEDLDLETSNQYVRDGDRYMICSDGLTNELSRDRLLAILDRETNATACARALIDEVLTTRARDNVSVVIVDVLGAWTEGDTGSPSVRSAPAPASVDDASTVPRSIAANIA